MGKGKASNDKSQAGQRAEGKFQIPNPEQLGPRQEIAALVA